MHSQHVPLGRFHYLERAAPTIPALIRLEDQVSHALSRLEMQPEGLRKRRIAVAAGSRGIAQLDCIVRAACGWLRAHGAQPFVFPAMGSHGGGTAEGQRNILEQYGVTPEKIGADLRSNMESVPVGVTDEGFKAYMDRQAWESDGVLVINRVKPHTDFTGRIESGLSKMIAVGMGKIEGAQEVHRQSRKHGFERVIRGISGCILQHGKIIAGLAVIENELHEVCALKAARASELVAVEEAALEMARPLVPRLPYSKIHVLVVDEMGKNISGAGMDTKVIGRGVELPPHEDPSINVIFVRDLTHQSAGNAIGIGFADVTHDRLYSQIDFQKMYLNALTSLNPPVARVPVHLSSDRAALDLALGAAGSPEPQKQRVIWIQNTLELRRIAVSEAFAQENGQPSGWRLVGETFTPQFDAQGDLIAASNQP